MTKKMLFRVLTLFIFVNGNCLFAGTVDSLKTLLATGEVDTHRVGMLCKLGYELRNLEPEAALGYLDEGLALGKKLGYGKGCSRAELYRGWVFTSLGNFSEAENALNQALKGYQKLKDSGGTGKAWNKLGILYFNQGEYAKAIIHFERAQEYFTDGKAIAMTYNNIGLALKAQGEGDQYLSCMLRARKELKELGEPEFEAFILGNLGAFYESLGQPDKAIDYYRQAAEVLPENASLESRASVQANLGVAHRAAGDEEKAAVAFRKTIALAREGGLVVEEAIGLTNLAVYYEDKGEFDKAEERYLASLELFEQTGNAKYQAAVVNNIGEMLLSKGDSLAALEYIHQALSLALKDGDLQVISKVYKNLAGLYELVGKPDEALRYQKLYGQMRDSLLDDTKLREIIALEMEYEAALQAEKLEVVAQENSEISQENTSLWWALMTVVVMVLVAATLLWRQRKAMVALRQNHFDVALAYAEVNGRLAEISHARGGAPQEGKLPTEKGPGLPPKFEQVSKREIEVFLCLANGLANKSIADELHISVDTVRSHVKNIYGKLGVRNRGMVISMAHEYGMVT